MFSYIVECIQMMLKQIHKQVNVKMQSLLGFSKYQRDR